MSTHSFAESEFHPTSFCDGNGRVFWSKGELYRGIPPKCVEFTQKIFSSGVVDDLIAKKFIPRTELTDASLPGYPLVLHHERIPFVTYAYEWSPSMLRDAGVFALDLLRELARHDLTLTDVTSWDILFAGCEPRFVDFSSIIGAPDNQAALWDILAPYFSSYFLRPLELFAHGRGNLARLLLTDYQHGPIQAEFHAAVRGTTIADRLPRSLSKVWRRGANAILHRVRAFEPLRHRAIANPDSYFMKKVAQCERQFSKFNFPHQSAASQVPPESHAILARLTHNAAAQSALVLGGDDETNALLAKTGAAVIAIDSDERRVDAIYEKARTNHANILPLVMDLRYPAPGYGVWNSVLAPALTRLRCDLVVALHVIESLIFVQRLQFEQIAGTFAELTLRTLIVDFPPPENPTVVEHLRDPYFAWFSLDHFIKALEKHFHSIRAERSTSEVATLIICEKIVR